MNICSRYQNSFAFALAFSSTPSLRLKLAYPPLLVLKRVILTLLGIGRHHRSSVLLALLHLGRKKQGRTLPVRHLDLEGGDDVAFVGAEDPRAAGFVGEVFVSAIIKG